MHLDNIWADALLVNVKLEVYPDDELGEYRNEKDGRECSMGPCRKLSPFVRVPKNVSSEC